MKKKSPFKRFLFIILFIVLLPLIILEGIIKLIVKLVKKKKDKKMLDSEFYDLLSIEKIDIMDGITFEQFLKRLFLFRGYKVTDTARTGDFGADLVLEKDGQTTVVQAKRYNNNVGSKALQEIYSAKAHYHADNMIVISNSHFTKQAEFMAKEQDIELIDREELIAIMDETKSELERDFGLSELKASATTNDYNDNFKYRI